MKTEEYRIELPYLSDDEIYDLARKSGYVAFSKDVGKHLKTIIKKQYGSIRSLAECLSCVTNREIHTEQVYVSSLIHGRMFQTTKFPQYRAYVEDLLELLEDDENHFKSSLANDLIFGFVPPENGRIPLEEFLANQESATN